MSRYLKIWLLLLLVGGIGYGLHFGVLRMTRLDALWQQTTYTLTGLYVFGGIASLIVSLLLCAADFALKKYISFVFLGCVLLKAIASYVFIREGLNVFANDFLELNFLVSFFIFLLYDVYVAYRLVNQEISGVEK